MEIAPLLPEGIDLKNDFNLSTGGMNAVRHKTRIRESQIELHGIEMHAASPNDFRNAIIKRLPFKPFRVRIMNAVIRALIRKELRSVFSGPKTASPTDIPDLFRKEYSYSS